MPLRLHTTAVITLAATLALALPAAAQQATVRLPNLGYSAGTMMPPAEAHEYGAEFLRELRGAHLVLGDPLVDQYLSALGYRLAAASPDPTQHYTFTMLNVPQINSFATFGGYIFIFSGLVTITQSQDELAAVMAHELAHISEHHLQRSMEDQKKTRPLYIIGALAAAAAAGAVNSGSHGAENYSPWYGGYSNGGSSEAAIGALESVFALMQQHQVNYTRADEATADHVGIDTLAKAGFNPEGMADMFAHMQDVIRPGGNGGIAAGNMPGFLENHPVTSVRIADARARAHVLDKQLHLRFAKVNGKMQYAVPTDSGDPPALLPLPFVKQRGNLLDASARSPSELQYTLIRERVRVLSSGNPRGILDYYEHNMARSTQFAMTTSNRYGYALALIQMNQAAKAVPVMQELANAYPGNLILALGLANAERHAGERSEALKHYAALNAQWPNDSAIVLSYSQALLDSGAKGDAKTAQGLLKPLLNDTSEPSLYATYGHACNVAGNPVGAGIAYADATFLEGHAADALAQLHSLLKRKDLNYYTRARINARIAEFTPIVLEIRRRHLDRGSGDGDSLRGGDTLPKQKSGLHFGVCAATGCTPQ
ncbi:MAG TPA: M48 family metalloprotease [Rhodanobacteraceae bacterium]